jgi:hypothetical protein
MTDGGSAAPETITFLVDVRGRPLTKSFRRVGGKLVKGAYPNVAEFRAVAVPVNDIVSMAAALTAVTGDGTAAAIRGTPGKFYPTNGAPAFRLLYPQEGLVAARTGARIPLEKIRKENLKPDDDTLWAVTWLPMFEDAPRHWAIFDVDRVPVPEHLSDDWVDEPEEAVGCVRELLPEPFRAATCWWCVSSSAAIPEPTGRAVSEVFKLKLAFWLDRALLSREIKSWMAAEKAPVDPAVFVPTQLIYIARPKMDGTHDPVPRRFGLLRGEVDTVAVPAVLPEPEPHEYSYGPGRAEGFEPADGLEGLVEQIRARLQGEPHVRQHLMAAAGSYVAQHGANIAQAPLVAALEVVALEFRSPGEVAGYGVDRMVAYAAAQARSTTWRPFAPIALHAHLAAFWGEEGTNRFRAVNDQRRFLRDWISRQHLYAIARRELAALRTAAFAAEGLA